MDAELKLGWLRNVVTAINFICFILITIKLRTSSWDLMTMSMYFSALKIIKYLNTDFLPYSALFGSLDLMTYPVGTVHFLQPRFQSISYQVPTVHFLEFKITYDTTQ